MNELTINYRFIPTLKHMAAVRVILPLFYDPDIEKILKQEIQLPFKYFDYDRERMELWKLIETKAMEKLSFLPLSLQMKVSKYIRPLHTNAIQWMKDHHRLLEFGCPKYYLTCKGLLCWNINGTIDRIKTAKNLIKEKEFSFRIRFAVACTYFLEDEVLALWYGEERAKRVFRGDMNVAVRFWMERLKKGTWRKKSWVSMIKGYFEKPSVLRDIRRTHTNLKLSCIFPHLSCKGKISYLKTVTMRHCLHLDDLQQCMQTMNERQRKIFFRRHPVPILLTFLEWPYQSLFMAMARQLQMQMHADRYEALLNYIVMSCIYESLDDFDYLGLLKELWCLIPDSYKAFMKRTAEDFGIIEVALYYEENPSLTIEKALENAILTNPPCW